MKKAIFQVLPFLVFLTACGNEPGQKWWGRFT